MRWRIASRAEIIDGAHESLTEVMLPDAIYDYPCDERTSAVIEVRHPFREGAALLSGIITAAGRAGRGPVIRRCFAARERSEKAQLHWLALRAEIAAGQQEILGWLRAVIGESISGRQCFRFARFDGFERFLARVPLGPLLVGKKTAQLPVFHLQLFGKFLREFLGRLALRSVFQKRFLFVSDFQRVDLRVPCGLLVSLSHDTRRSTR